MQRDGERYRPAVAHPSDKSLNALAFRENGDLDAPLAGAQGPVGDDVERVQEGLQRRLGLAIQPSPHLGRRDVKESGELPLASQHSGGRAQRFRTSMESIHRPHPSRRRACAAT